MNEIKNRTVPREVIIAFIIIVFLIFCTIFQDRPNDRYKLTLDPSTPTLNQDSTEFTGTFAAQPGNYNVEIAFEKAPESGGTVTLTNHSINPDNTYTVKTQDVAFEKGQMKVALGFTVNSEFTDYNLSILFNKTEIDPSVFDSDSIVVQSTEPVWNDTYFLAVVLGTALAGLLFLLYKMKTYTGFEKITVIILTAACLFSCSPLFNDFLLNGHDLEFHITRIEGLAQSLSSGQFPVRIQTELYAGFGYDNSVFYPDLFLYIPAALRMMGVSVVYSYKTLLFLINIATTVISYKSFSKLLKNKEAGLIAAVLYVLATYRLMNMYTRADLGEALAMTFLPMVILGVYNLLKGDSRRWLAAAIGFTCILESHVLTSEIVLVFCILFAILSWRSFTQKERLANMGKTVLVFLLLNLWFLVPFLDFFKGIAIFSSHMDLYDMTVWPHQLWMSIFNTTGLFKALPAFVQGQNMSNDMPLSIGASLVAGLFVYILGMAYFGRKGIKDMRNHRIVLYSMLFGIIALWMSTPLFPWQLLQMTAFLDKLVSPLQFAWRLLIVATVFFCIAAAYGVTMWKEHKQWGKVLYTGVLIVVLVSAVFQAGYYIDDFTGNQKIAFTKETTLVTTQREGFYYYKDTDIDALVHKDPVLTVKDPSIKISGYTRAGGKVNFDYSGAHPGDNIVVPLYYFKGVMAVDETGKELPTISYDNHLTLIELQKESGHVLVQWYPRKIYRAAELVSLSTLVLIIIMKIKRKRKESAQGQITA